MLREFLEHSTCSNIPKNQEALITSCNQNLLMDWMCGKDEGIFWQFNLGLTSEIIIKSVFDSVPYFDTTLILLLIIEVT